MFKDITKSVTVAVILMLLAAAGGYLFGFWETLREANTFFKTENGKIRAEITLRELAETVKIVPELKNEYSQLATLMLTKTGNCAVQPMGNRMSAVVSRRSPYKRGDKLIVENISSDNRESVSVVIIGDFEARDDIMLIKVGQDAGRLLNIPEGQTIRVEVRPEK